MRAGLAGLALAAAVSACPPVWAQAADAGEIAFWRAVSQDDAASSYQAYLEAYPNGVFAAVARLRLARSSAAPRAAAVGSPVGSPVSPAVARGAWVRPGRAEASFVGGVVVDVDAQGLRNGSNWRLWVAPAGSPDEPADRGAFLANSVAITASRMHVTVPSGPPGTDEVRLYWIPGSSDSYVVAARAAVTVGPGVAGAVLMRTLAREAAQLGPVRFEAAHRDRPMLIQAAFLRLRPQSEWNYAWFEGRVGVVARPEVVLQIGQPGAVADEYGSFGEGICLLDASGAMLDRVASLVNGAPVVVRAIPTSWSSAGSDSPVLLDRCQLKP